MIWRLLWASTTFDEILLEEFYTSVYERWERINSEINKFIEFTKNLDVLLKEALEN